MFSIQVQDHSIDTLKTFTCTYARKAMDNTGDFRPKVRMEGTNRRTWECLRKGNINYLNATVLFTERVVTKNGLDQASWLNKLGSLLALRHERTGAIDDLRQAICHVEAALDAIPPNHPCQVGWLNNLGNLLGRKFERTGAFDDLENAIKQTTKAMELTLSSDLNRADRLNSVGSWLARRYERVGNVDDLETALRLVQEAVDITSSAHPNKPVYLTCLGNMLAWRFKLHGNHSDMDQAIYSLKNAMELIPVPSPVRADLLSNLATMSVWIYEKNGQPGDLQRAINLTKETLRTMPLDHPNRAASYFSLGDFLYYQSSQHYKAGASTDDYLSYYLHSLACSNAPNIVRIRSAQKVATILSERGRWKESSEALGYAVELLTKLNAFNLKLKDQQYMLREFAGLGTLATATALQAGKGAQEALQLLNVGRGVIANLKFSLQNGIGTLNKQHPETTSRSERYQHILDSPGRFVILPNVIGENTLQGQPLKSTSHCDGTITFREAADDIYQLPNFGRFLNLPMEDELKAAAANGPIAVINVTPWRCDALLLTEKHTRAMQLPHLLLKDIKRNVELLKSVCASSESNSYKQTTRLLQMLEWLWDAVAHPILEELGFRKSVRGSSKADDWPRMWWVPTGLLSLLPLHAAGRHRSNPSEAVIERVISSYSPSVIALLHAQNQPLDLSQVLRKVLLVSMPTTPGAKPLPSATDEILSVKKTLPVSAATTMLEMPWKIQVVHELRSCSIFHFAGHGNSDPRDPSMSHLLLQDGFQNRLTVDEIMCLDRNEAPAFLSYLSACSTGVNSAACLQDESINLMTACQLAGFRHTVGSLWDVYDKYSALATQEFYGSLRWERIIDDKSVAWAVHLAARRIRQETSDPKNFASSEGGNPLAWAAYIHMGPYVLILAINIPEIQITNALQVMDLVPIQASIINEGDL